MSGHRFNPNLPLKSRAWDPDRVVVQLPLNRRTAERELRAAGTPRRPGVAASAKDRALLRLLDGVACYGYGADQIIDLMQGLREPASAAELRGEPLALRAFREANGIPDTNCGADQTDLRQVIALPVPTSAPAPWTHEPWTNELTLPVAEVVDLAQATAPLKRAPQRGRATLSRALPTGSALVNGVLLGAAAAGVVVLCLTLPDFVSAPNLSAGGVRATAIEPAPAGGGGQGLVNPNGQAAGQPGTNQGAPEPNQGPAASNQVGPGQAEAGGSSGVVSNLITASSAPPPATVPLHSVFDTGQAQSPPSVLSPQELAHASAASSAAQVPPGTAGQNGAQPAVPTTAPSPPVDSQPTGAPSALDTTVPTGPPSSSASPVSSRSGPTPEPTLQLTPGPTSGLTPQPTSAPPGAGQGPIPPTVTTLPVLPDPATATSSVTESSSTESSATESSSDSASPEETSPTRGRHRHRHRQPWPWHAYGPQ